MEVTILSKLTTHPSGTGGNHGVEQPSDGIFSNMLRGLHEISCAAKKEPQSSGENVSEEDLEELLGFLQREELPEIDDILEILDSFFPFHGLDLNALLKLEGVLQEQSDSAELSGYNKLGQTGQKNTVEIGMEEMLRAMNGLLSLPSKEMVSKLDEGLILLVKAAKLFELMGHRKSLSVKQGQLHELLEQLTKKVEQLLEKGQEQALLHKGKETWRKAYLQGIFSEVATGATERTDSLILRENMQSSQSQMKILLGDPFVGLQWSKPEQLTLYLHSSAKETTSSRLIRQFENILSKSQFTNIGGTQKLSLRLIPEHLGRLSIELVQKDGGMIAKILTSTSLAKETLESQLIALKQAFSGQNIQLEKIEITEQLPQSQENFFDREQYSQEQDRERQENYHYTDDGEEGDGDFTIRLEEALLYMEA